VIGWRALFRSAWRRDSGVTLMELMVGMTIMAIFMTMFTTSVVMMYNSTSKTEAVADTASQLSMAFNRLDTSVRYASGITQPGIGSDGNSYVEWRSTYSGTAVCTQLRLASGVDQLQQRTWTPSTSGTVTGLTPWQPLASNVRADSGVGVFTLPAIAAGTPGKLRIHLVAETMGRSGKTDSVSDVTFTAFNTLPGPTPAAGTFCTEVHRP
jgi:prepilin-type N-terminal cleavage/methylation domain-containing protein